MLLQQLLFFHELSKHKSINKAAIELHTTQSNLSQSIINLEEELGIVVITRSNKGVSLTKQGYQLLKYCKPIVENIGYIRKIATVDVNQGLSISSYPFITSSRLVGDFYNLYEEDINIRLKEARIEEIFTDVSEMKSEIGIIQVNETQKNEITHLAKRKKIDIQFITQDTWFVNVNEHHPLAKQSLIDMRELLPYAIVRPQDDYLSTITTNNVMIDNVPLTDFKKAVFLNNSGAIINFIKTTNAFQFCPSCCEKDFTPLGIKTIPIKNCDMRIKIGWICKSKGQLSEEATQFVRLLNDHFYDFSFPLT